MDGWSLALCRYLVLSSFMEHLRTAIETRWGSLMKAITMLFILPCRIVFRLETSSLSLIDQHVGLKIKKLLITYIRILYLRLQET